MAKRITDGTREVHRVAADPGWVQGDVVSAEAFLPRTKDNGHLSAANKGCTADEAIADWQSRFKRSKANRTVTLTVEEYGQLGLSVYNDSGPDSLHVHIDMTDATVEIVAEQLARRCRVLP